jgi:hypothetical protein
MMDGDVCEMGWEVRRKDDGAAGGRQQTPTI